VSAAGRRGRTPGLALLALALAACAFPVQGAFLGGELPEAGARRRTIVIVYNHGFSSEAAGTYRPRVPPILDAARQRNPDVLVYSQVRNTVHLEAVHHSAYVESAVQHFEQQGVPRGNIILAGQSCGGWGSLQAAAYTYPDVGGVVAFAPTCHGRLPHSTATRLRRRGEIEQLAGRLRFPGVIFLYEGDAYYQLDDWAALSGRAHPALRVERLDRAAVSSVCRRCARDSHGAVWEESFGAVYFESHLQPLIERVRERIRSREGG
jgi:dienelactone hydrolase